MDNAVLMAAAAGILVALLNGKAIRRILLLPFRKIAEKTATREDDIIVEEAAKDLGIHNEEDKKDAGK